MDGRRLSALGAVVALVAMSTGDVSAAPRDREKWNRTYGRRDYVYGSAPIPTLTAWRELLASRAKGGRALDVAAGECQNGVWLATLGYDVDCVDISAAGLAKGAALARRARVARRVHAVEADLEQWQLPPGAYDCIVNSRFLLRRLAPGMVAGLRPGGILVFETFTADDPSTGGEGAPRAYFLERNELLRLFPSLHVVWYHERRAADGRAVATLVARKPGAGDPLEGARPAPDPAPDAPSCDCRQP